LGRANKPVLAHWRYRVYKVIESSRNYTKHKQGFLEPAGHHVVCLQFALSLLFVLFDGKKYQKPAAAHIRPASPRLPPGQNRNSLVRFRQREAVIKNPADYDMVCKEHSDIRVHHTYITLDATQLLEYREQGSSQTQESLNTALKRPREAFRSSGP